MNKYIEFNDYYKIIIYNNKNNGYCLIDKDDYDKVIKHKWYIKDTNSGKGYVACKIKNKTIKLHRYILNIYDKNIVVDHLNRDIWDCRKNNLRKTDYFNNNINSSFSKNNTSGRTGVIFSKRNKNHSEKWSAQVTINKIRKSKSFSISKYGYEKAFELACKQREIWEKEYNILTEKVQRLSKA